MLDTLSQLIISIICIIFSPFVLIPAVIIFFQYKLYIKSTYFQITHIPFFKRKYDIGKYGEYLIYKSLKYYENSGARFLFNIYVPKEDGGTSEIDVLMLCEYGIFVFESKNYSGWIFGNEFKKYWYQILPKGRGRSNKEKFYNPILQNKSHINHLKSFIGDGFLFHSIIVFSRRCTFKNLEINSTDVCVIHRNNLKKLMKEIIDNHNDRRLSPQEITEIYDKLYPLTQCNDEIKNKHINDIQNIR